MARKPPWHGSASPIDDFLSYFLARLLSSIKSVAWVGAFSLLIAVWRVLQG